MVQAKSIRSTISTEIVACSCGHINEFNRDDWRRTIWATCAKCGGWIGFYTYYIVYKNKQDNDSKQLNIPENKNGHCWHCAPTPDGGNSSQFFRCCHCGGMGWTRRELVPPEGHGPYHPQATPGNKWLFDGNEESCCDTEHHCSLCEHKMTQEIIIECPQCGSNNIYKRG